jgi:hypothetical protein
MAAGTSDFKLFAGEPNALTAWAVHVMSAPLPASSDPIGDTDTKESLPPTMEAATPAEWLFQNLRYQRELIAERSGILPPRATDFFSQGYVTGYCDAYMQEKQMPKDVEATGTVLEVFIGLFGLNAGTNLATNVFRNQSHPDIRRGMLAGGNDLLSWTRRGKAPHGWVDHVV